MRNANSLHEGAFMAAPDAMALLDDDGKIIAVNRAWCDYAQANGGDGDGYLGSHYLQASPMVNDPEQARIHARLSALLAGKLDELEVEYPCHSPGRQRWFLLHASRFQYSSGRGVLVVHLDITARRLAEEWAREAASRDPLTGMFNRRSFMERAEQSLKLADRSKKLLALLFIDLDGFKPINDRYGHGVGDQVLKEISRRLQVTVREHDAPARIGGDEFVMICPECEEPDLQRLIERIHSVIEETMEIEGQRFNVSCSIGVARYPQDGQNVQQLLEVADRAMYQMKADHDAR